MVHLERGVRRGRRATLADSASELSSIRKSSDALKPSNARLRPIRTTLCAHCGSDKLRKQISLAHCASHQLVALLPARTHRSIRAGLLKNPRPVEH